MRKFFKIFFSVVVILYFSATMFYCFVAGTPEAGKGAAIYIMSAAGQFFFQRLPVDAFTTLFTSEKNWMKRANDLDLCYDNSKEIIGDTA